MVDRFLGLIPRPFSGFGSASPVEIWFDAVGQLI
jgi:hypothetical protein